MKSTSRLMVLLSVAALVVAACSGGQPAPRTPPPTASYGPATQGGYAAPPRPEPVYAATPPAPRGTPGNFTWHTRLADAQAQARREGKLILVGSTQAGCSLCEKFKNTIVPSASAQVSPVAVGYMLNTRQQETPRVWQILKANLPNENLMPLTGVLTPDLRYLTGFGGPPDATKLLNALATARRLYPVGARVEARPLRREPGQAQVNEFGEYEWTPLDSLWPRDALAPETEIAGEPVLPATQPAAEPTPTPTPTPASTPIVPAPTAVAAAPEPMDAVRERTAAEIAAGFAGGASPSPKADGWGDQALQSAYQDIQRGAFDAARRTLAEVQARVPGSPLAREAVKGQIAVWNAERIRDASGPERARLVEAARRNLGTSMWGGLFTS